MRYKLLDEALVQEIKRAAPSDRGRYLVLEEHPDFSGHWIVNCLAPSYILDFEDLIGSYRALAPAGLGSFLERARELSYSVAFAEEPTGVLEAYRALDAPPPFKLDSPLPGTVNGLLPFQVQGFNYLRDKSGMAVWGTGSGKTVLAASLIRYHHDADNFDVCWFVVKNHNKINTQRALKRLVGIDAYLIDGSKRSRQQTYQQLREASGAGRKVVVVLNYEKFRDDFCEFVQDEDKDDPTVVVREEFESLLGARCLYIWDEMPTKLKTRTTQLYKAICKCLYKTRPPIVKEDKRRAKGLIQYALSATPIENGPEDVYNCIRLMVPSLFGTVQDFRGEYVKRYSYWDLTRPEVWHNLDRMSLRLTSVCHQIDKADPDIAVQFPTALSIPRYIDWDPEIRLAYDRLEALAREAKDSEEGLNVLGLIGVFRMLCDAPSIVNDSAALFEAYESAQEAFSADLGAWAGEPAKQGSETALRLLQALGRELSDRRHTKLEALRQILVEEHPDEKAVLFASLNRSLMPVLAARLGEWGVPYVRFAGSSRQKQAAQDSFQCDPAVRVFLSSDQGSDSINLEAGSVVIHYDLPWKWSTKVQRENRIHRITSTFETVRYYLLMMADSIEDRMWKIIEKKMGYHQAIFGGAVADQSMSARMSMEDLMYILLGE